MAAGRISLDITEATIERDDESADLGRGASDRGVITPGETLVLDRVDVVASSSEDRCRTCGKIFVELDLHAEATAGYSSRASSAP